MLYGYNFKYCLEGTSNCKLRHFLTIAKEYPYFFVCFRLDSILRFESKGLCETLAFNIRDALKLSKGGSSLLRQQL